ncbi:copper resistance CopC family protein [Micromonospora sp. NPDC050495]|uniref:copper resistance CopC family protein n=1 Tax=Micromonospora sp. NPDC050495 TaxID=3154936 RepID=UPI0033E56263
MTGRRRPRTSSLVGGAVALLAVSVVVLAALAGSAPPRLTAATPGDGARLAQAPGTVTLTFSGQLDARDTHASVVDLASGRRINDATRVDGTTVRLPITAARAGEYRTAYHVTLVDGRELTGQLGFAVTAGGGAPDPAAASAPSPGTGSGLHRHGAVDGLSGVLIGVDVLVMAGLLLFALTRRRARRSTGRWAYRP